MEVQLPGMFDVEVTFQPIVSVPTGSAAGAEALLRGRIEGTAFPPRALVRQLRARECPVAELVIGHIACAFDLWDDVGVDPVWCSLNLDAWDLEHGRPDEMIADVVGAERAHRVVVELSELHPLDPSRAGSVLERLRKLGVTIAIEDFGVGQAASDQLDLLEPAYIKICLLYTSPSPRDQRGSRMPSSA